MSLVKGYSSEDSYNSDLEINNAEDHSYVITSDIKTSSTAKRTISGFIQEEAVDNVQFKNNKRLYDALGDKTLTENKKAKILSSFKATKCKSKEFRRKRKSKGNSSKFDDDSDGYQGPWARQISSSESEDELNQGEEEEGKAEYEEEEKSTFSDIAESTKKSTPEEFSNYYGPSSITSLLSPPQSITTRFSTTVSGIQSCFVPKRLEYTQEGHKSGVQSLQFLPTTGHLLLSSGTDRLIKLWATSKPHILLRDYAGHSRPVKHATFSHSGSNFVSCAYDKTVKIWDTESGAVNYKMNLASNPNMSRFVPNTESEFMVALDNSKVEHMDWRVGDSVQTYSHHLSSVTCIEFINGGRQFITASDDRTLKIWDIRVNMPIKQIADPKQHSMPIVKMHPNGRWFVGQSMDNTIQTYSTSATDKFKKNRKKLFRGHNCSGYAIDVKFSPDGKNLVSGDSFGNCYFWDWKTTKVIKKIKVDNDVISCVDVHPLEKSVVAVAGSSGKIYVYS